MTLREEINESKFQKLKTKNKIITKQNQPKTIWQ